MPAIKGQPAPKPGGTPAPVPGAQQKSVVDDFFAEFDAPQMQNAAPSGNVVDDFFAAGEESAPVEAPVMLDPEVPTESPMARMERSGFSGAAKEIVGDAVARFQTAWGVTDREKKTKLTEIYGKDGVRQKDGKFQIRRPGEKGFRDFDPDTGLFSLDIMGDILDWSRDVAEGATELGGRIAGGLGGAAIGAGQGAAVGGLAGAPTGPGALATGAAGAATGGMLGAISGYAAGGALGSAASLAVGDMIAEKLVGIKRDPTRDAGKEAALAAGIGGGIGGAFGVASGYLARRRIAREARLSSLTAQEVRSNAEEIAKAADSLSRNGINLKQGRMVLTPGQIGGDLLPEGRALDKELSTEGKVRDFMVEQGKMVLDGWEKLQRGIVNVTGKPESDLFQSVKSAARTTREVEGKTIGTFRDMALKASDNQPLPMKRTVSSMGKFMQDVGMTLGKDGKLQGPSLRQLQEKFPDASPAVLGKLKSLASDLENTLKRNNGGSLPLKETDRIYGMFRDTIDNFKGTSTGDRVARSLIEIKDALRDDWTEHIGATLSQKRPDALSAYTKSMEKYSDIMIAQKTLGNVLKKNDLSAAALADQIFSPAQGKDRVAQLKTLINDTDPDLWPALVGHKLQGLQIAATNPKTGRINWQTLDSQINKLERSEVLDQMMSPEQRANLRNFFTIAKRVDSDFAFKEGAPVSKSTISQARNLLVTIAAPVSFLARLGAGQDMTQNMLQTIGKDRALVKWLNGEGLELVLKDLPKKEQNRIRAKIMPLLEGAGSAVMAGERREAVIDSTQQAEEE